MSERSTIAAGPGWIYSRWGYAIARCIQQFKKRKLASLSTLLVLGVTLTLPSLLFFAYATLHSAGSKSLESESITVFLAPDVNDLQGAELAGQWLERTDIRETEFISSDEALNMLERNTDLQDIAQTLGGNPLPGAIVLYPHPSAGNEAVLNKLADELRSNEAVDRVQLDLQWVHRLQAVIALVKWIGGLLAIFLTMTALLVITNTIRLEMARRRPELEVTQLLGASAAFINRPILITGALYGFLGGLIACLLASSGLIAIQSSVRDLVSLYDGEWLVTMPTASQILSILGISTLLGLVGAISSLYRSSHELTHPQPKTH